MPRKPRFYLPGIPAHIVQRGNCRQAVFFSNEDYSRYLIWLGEGAVKYGCQIHAYVLMTNHVHLLMTPQSQDSISKTIQYVGRNYVTYVNRSYRKGGTLWEGRHKGCLLSDDDYLFICMRYIELNPVRAGMVEHPGDYRWSSFHQNATANQGTLLTPQPLYQSLGLDKYSRAQVYRGLFRQSINPGRLTNIQETVQTGTPLGNDRFREQIVRTLQCRLARHAVEGLKYNGY